MRGYRRALRSAISSEAKAYGFTLTVWSSGAVVTHQHGTPEIGDVFAYLSGALIAMALVVGITFGSPSEKWTSSEPTRYAFGAIHLVSVIAAVVAGWATGAMTSGGPFTFGLVAFVAVLAYQLLLGAEVALSSTGEEPSE